jgi:phage-related protein
MLVKYLLPHLKKRDFKIKLDEFGSCVWQQIDDRKTVMQIGGHLKEQFGEQVEPVYERLGMFVNLLARRNFISLESEKL